MSKSIVVLDTNILASSPLLDSKEWTDLHAHATDWRLNFVVPEIVVMETVNVVRRKWHQTRSQLKQLAPWAHSLGMDNEFSAISDAADGRDAGYESALRSRISELEAEVVSLPDTIDHMDIVICREDFGQWS